MQFDGVTGIGLRVGVWGLEFRTTDNQTEQKMEHETETGLDIRA